MKKYIGQYLRGVYPKRPVLKKEAIDQDEIIDRYGAILIVIDMRRKPKQEDQDELNTIKELIRKHNIPRY